MTLLIPIGELYTSYPAEDSSLSLSGMNRTEPHSEEELAEMFFIIKAVQCRPGHTMKIAGTGRKASI